MSCENRYFSTSIRFKMHQKNYLELKKNISDSLIQSAIQYIHRVHRGRDRMVVGITTTCAISAYHR